jgi:hypothetical protein
MTVIEIEFIPVAVQKVDTLDGIVRPPKNCGEVKAAPNKGMLQETKVRRMRQSARNMRA